MWILIAHSLIGHFKVRVNMHKCDKIMKTKLYHSSIIDFNFLFVTDSSKGISRICSGVTAMTCVKPPED